MADGLLKGLEGGSVKAIVEKVDVPEGQEGAGSGRIVDLGVARERSQVVASVKAKLGLEHRESPPGGSKKGANVFCEQFRSPGQLVELSRFARSPSALAAVRSSLASCGPTAHLRMQARESSKTSRQICTSPASSATSVLPLLRSLSR